MTKAIIVDRVKEAARPRPMKREYPSKGRGWMFANTVPNVDKYIQNEVAKRGSDDMYG
jgi:hypothetical protein